MSRPSTSRSLLTLLVVAAAALGCSPQAAKKSGFLKDYSQLTPDSRLSGAMSYRNLEKLAQYDKFMVDPIVVHFAPNAGGTSLNPDKLDEVTSFAHQQLVQNLATRYQVVDRPGPGVLRIRIAITDIQKSEAAWNILPTTKIAGMGLGGASIEAETVDSVTGERVTALVDSRPGERISLEGLGPTDHAKQAIRAWVRAYMDLLREIRESA